MKRIITIIFILMVILTGCTSIGATSVDPFGHIFRVEEVLTHEDPNIALENTPLFNLDIYRNLYIIDDTRTYEYESIGEFQKGKLSDEDTRKNIWVLAAEDSFVSYELSIEADNSVTISKLVNSRTSWKYRLDRVDTISVYVSTTGEQSNLEIDWYFSHTFPGNLVQLSSANIYNQGKVGFAIEDKSVTELLVYEDYYTNGNAEHREYRLNEDEGFGLSVSTRYESGEQYAIYRIPYKNGEYIFYLNFPVK